MAFIITTLVSVMDRNALRRKLRKRRGELSPAQRRQAAQRATRRLMRLSGWRNARHIALYYPHGSEIDPMLLLGQPANRHKRFYLPIILPASKEMRFAPLGNRWRRNRYGIVEPLATPHRRLRPAGLDFVVMPLLGFDAQGNRLGQGAGYYDRSFAFRLYPGRVATPKLVGLAFECQRREQLAAQPWDVPLDAVVTESASYLP